MNEIFIYINFKGGLSRKHSFQIKFFALFLLLFLLYNLHFFFVFHFKIQSSQPGFRTIICYNVGGRIHRKKLISSLITIGRKNINGRFALIHRHFDDPVEFVIILKIHLQKKSSKNFF